MFPLTVVVLELYYLGLVFVLCVLLPLSCIILCCCLRVVLYRGGPLFPLIFVVFELYYIWVCFFFVQLPLSCIILRCDFCFCLLYWLSFVSIYIKLSWHCIISDTSLYFASFSFVVFIICYMFDFSFVLLFCILYIIVFVFILRGPQGRSALC